LRQEKKKGRKGEELRKERRNACSGRKHYLKLISGYGLVPAFLTSSSARAHCHYFLAALNDLFVPDALHRVSEKKTSTHIIGYKLRNSCLILIIFDTKIPQII